VNPRLLELALEKQRLQMRSAAQRDGLAAAAARIAPLFAAGDAVRAGFSWLRRHPGWVTGTLVAVAVARPGWAFRWAGNAVLVMRAWRSLRTWQPGLFDR
jgi:hypothetical protein